MKTLLLVPGVSQPGTTGEGVAGPHPQRDYDALTAELGRLAGDTADLLDYPAVDAAKDRGTRLVCRLAGRDWALAWLGFQRRKAYDVIFTHGETVGLPLAVLLKLAGRRPGHVTIGHRLFTAKTRLFFTLLNVHLQMNMIFVYAQAQMDFAVDRFGLSENQMRLITFPIDDRFFRSRTHDPGNETGICAAGMEWTAYPTLIAAVAGMPDVTVTIAAKAPCIAIGNEIAVPALPPNVTARCYSDAERRALYSESAFVLVPLDEQEYQTSVKTLLEAMAMGKAVIATQAEGQADVLINGENGLCVAPSDMTGWRTAITRLRTDTALRERLGRNARRWVEQNASLSLWVDHVAEALRSCGA